FWRDGVSREDPSLLSDPVRLQAQRYPMRPQLMVTRVAALRFLDEAQWKAALSDLWFSFDHEIDFQRDNARDAKTDDDRELSESIEREVARDAAFAALWLGEDVTKARAYRTRAERTMQLNDEAIARFEAWASLRSGDAAGALAAFDKSSETLAITR